MQYSEEALKCETPLCEIIAFGEALVAMAGDEIQDESTMEARERLANMIVSRAWTIRRVLFPESQPSKPEAEAQ
jgi:hypothetical protein